MKNYVLSLILGIFVAVSAVADNKSEISQADFDRLHNAVKLVDGGMAEAALTDFDELLSKYPGNYLIAYERLYACYSLGRYDEVVKKGEKLLKSSEASPLVYQLVGNAYDILGKVDKSRSTYEKGLKRFPNSGPLYLEIGNTYLHQSAYNEAVENYNKGIDVDPDFASNYYRAAEIFFQVDKLKVWGLAYAETEILLNPNSSERNSVMALAIRNCLTDNVKIDLNADSVSAKVTLVPERDIIGNPDNGKFYLGFPGVYEGCLSAGAKTFWYERKPFTGSIADLAELRRIAVEAYFAATDNLYGNSMYLLPFQKKIIDAGHWEAYNYFLFSSVQNEEFEAWYSENESKLDAFIDWFNVDTFRLDAKHTVGMNTIYRDARDLDILNAMMVQAAILTQGDPADAKK